MQKKYLHTLLVILALIAILLLVAGYSLSAGELKIPLAKIPFILLKGKGTMEYIILEKIRLPRVILGIAVGGSLGLAGVILQGIYRNPLVEPYTLGVSGGASLGVTLIIVTGWHLKYGNFLLPFSGFAGALLSILIVYALSLRQGKLIIFKMVLIGVMFSFIASSLMMLLMATTTSENLHGIIFWMMGSLDETNDNMIFTVSAVSLLGLAGSYFFIRPLNALRLGEISAAHLGVNTDGAIKVLFVIASLLTGISVAAAGIIGFVGLIIPQLLRYVAGTDFRFLLIGSFIFGAAFLLFCDTVARTLIAPNELPIGVITGILGGIAFIVVLVRKNSQILISG
jgi:iron complex transport system permease protein